MPVLMCVGIGFLSVSSEGMYPVITKNKAKIKMILLTNSSMVFIMKLIDHRLDLGKRSSNSMRLIKEFP